MASRTEAQTPASASAFELGVVLDAHPGERGDLAAAQPGNAAGARRRAGRPAAGDLGPAGDEELADLGAVVHALDGTAASGRVGMPCQYTFSQGLPQLAETRFPVIATSLEEIPYVVW